MVVFESRLLGASAFIPNTENINKLLENLASSRLLGRVKEQDNGYKLRIKGEHKEEEEEEEEDSDDEQWVVMSYGYYGTTILLPEDAKVDEIKAEMKVGVLTIFIPRTEAPKKDVKEIQIK